MSIKRRWLLSFALAAVITTPATHAQTCKSDVPWEHVHDTDKLHVVTTDIKGSPATSIEVCRAAEESPAGVVVEVTFADSHGARELKAGLCTNKLAKWAIIRTRAAKKADGPLKLGGVYRLCRG